MSKLALSNNQSATGTVPPRDDRTSMLHVCIQVFSHVCPFSASSPHSMYRRWFPDPTSVSFKSHVIGEYTDHVGVHEASEIGVVLLVSRPISELHLRTYPERFSTYRTFRQFCLYLCTGCTYFTGWYVLVCIYSSVPKPPMLPVKQDGR